MWRLSLWVWLPHLFPSDYCSRLGSFGSIPFITSQWSICLSHSRLPFRLALILSKGRFKTIRFSTPYPLYKLLLFLIGMTPAETMAAPRIIIALSFHGTATQRFIIIKARNWYYYQFTSSASFYHKRRKWRIVFRNLNINSSSVLFLLWERRWIAQVSC